MTTKITVSYLQRNMSAVTTALIKGDGFIITRNGRTLAILRPAVINVSQFTDEKNSPAPERGR